MPRTVFNYTGEWQKFNVPADVEIITVTLKGAGSSGVAGGYVSGKMRVNPKRDLFIMVGQQGQERGGTAERQGGDVAVGGGGAGGRGGLGGRGGNGGAGATYVRWDARDGRIKAVAGGAGGASGDDALGGRGGERVGEIGAVAAGFPEVAESATGGTQSQSGQGGTSALGTSFYGRDGKDEKLARAGHGGEVDTTNNTVGGGGGGGGYYPGGGGAAGLELVAPSGGGAGGANFTGGLYTSVSYQGEGRKGDGQVVIEWIDPNSPNQPPTPPENIRIEGQPIADGLATKAKHKVTLMGTPDDPNQKQGVRLYVRVSRNKLFTRYRTFKGTYDPVDRRDKVVIDELTQDTRYYVRIHTQDNHGRISTNYRATNFWTNRAPTEPTLVLPAENAQFTSLVNVTFQWTHQDPDPSDSQTAFRLRYRRAETPSVPAGDWTQVEEVTNFNQWTIGAGAFKGNTLYEWSVRTRDEQDRWGTWSASRSFYIIAETTSPLLEWPQRNEAVVAVDDNEFRWKFRTPQPGTLQERADLRYRAVGAELWTTLTGDLVTPGDQWFWLIPAGTFEPHFQYEWEVRTWGVGDTEPSDWSDTARFWGVEAPESGPGIEVVASGFPQAPLGVGVNRVYIYDRGGENLRGEIKPLSMVRWNRKRDDISACTIVVSEWDEESRKFLSNLRTWQFEIVVFRDGVRVWEGPITRIGDQHGMLTIEARDVMAYVYRRIMRQGYNDSYRVMNGQQIGQSTVVERSARIIMNAMAYDDPNLLAYLTPLYAFDDAQNSRVVYDYAKTAWEEIDDLAATAGLDYVTVGRRIILWDTHRPVGRLPEMREADFIDTPIVSEYGMSAANYFAVHSQSNVWGAAERLQEDGTPGPTGWIEQLATAYGESETVSTDRNLTRQDRERLARTLAAQAERNIEGRWPPPVVVRVPDNSMLNPDLNLGINQLVPGVWIPLRAQGAIRSVSQWQKLDSIEVNQDAEGEKITVVMSPAPQAGEDPDADAVVEEG